MKAVHLALGADALSTWLVHLCHRGHSLGFLARRLDGSERLKEFVIAGLVMQGAMIGCFLAADVVLFYLFFEAMLIPVLVLVAHRATPIVAVRRCSSSSTPWLPRWVCWSPSGILVAAAGTSNIAELIEALPGGGSGAGAHGPVLLGLYPGLCRQNALGALPFLAGAHLRRRPQRRHRLGGRDHGQGRHLWLYPPGDAALPRANWTWHGLLMAWPWSVSFLVR